MISSLIKQLRPDDEILEKAFLRVSVSPWWILLGIGEKQLVSVLLATVLLVGCTVGPGYKRPAAQVPDTWKGEGPWQTAAPKDAIPKGAWWQIFHDAELDRLEQELLQANQSLAAAQDRLSQARSLARIASSAYFPTLSADPSGQRQRLSGNRPLSGRSRQARHAERFYRPVFR